MAEKKTWLRWTDLEDIHHQLADADRSRGRSGSFYDELWAAAGQGNWADIQSILDEIGYDFDDGEVVVDFEIKRTPDDILGEWISARVQTRGPLG